jgi:hypothetical protein
MLMQAKPSSWTWVQKPKGISLSESNVPAEDASSSIGTATADTNLHRVVFEF